ncbi:hypothetical protein MJ579_06655 [Klebsiella pneumoniae]|nr:hypothetical protein MJ579_06655 [Klebsiella pneumoniae]
MPAPNALSAATTYLTRATGSSWMHGVGRIGAAAGTFAGAGDGAQPARWRL